MVLFLRSAAAARNLSTTPIVNASRARRSRSLAGVGDAVWIVKGAAAAAAGAAGTAGAVEDRRGRRTALA